MSESDACFACEALEPRALLTGIVKCIPVEDPVIYWNKIAIDAVQMETEYTGPGYASRNLAMVQGAVFDAVNAIKGGYQPYLYHGSAPACTSVDAAVATAAETVLVAVFPSSAAYVQTKYNAYLAGIPNGTAENNGVAVGQAAANAMLVARANDHAYDIVPYTPGTGPGDYRPTPPDYDPAWGPGWGMVTPFGIPDAASYLPPPPPALRSLEYTMAYYQVMLVGAANTPLRTADQTQIARFWSYDAQQYGTPPVHMNEIAQDIAIKTRNTLVENARLFALINFAMGDAGIVAWAAKYINDLWRPTTAIQQGNADTNPLTIGDRNWKPMGYSENGLDNRTPPFPSCTSGHSTFGAAMFRVMADFYGTDRFSFNATSDELPGVVRHYCSFSQAAQEQGISRIYLGVHFNFDNTLGLLSGRNIGTYDSANLLRPAASGIRKAPVSFPVVSAAEEKAATLWSHGAGQDQRSAPLFSTVPIRSSADLPTTSSADADPLRRTPEPLLSR